MSSKGAAYVAGIYEHPTRKAEGISLAQLHADVAIGALEDAGLTAQDVDGYFCASDAPGVGTFAMGDYLGMRKLR
jgi:acetyl-CoA C-acetyltransferase